jgi:hypothetical protein
LEATTYLLQEKNQELNRFRGPREFLGDAFDALIELFSSKLIPFPNYAL